MFLFRRATLCAACAALVLAFITAEELAGGAPHFAARYPGLMAITPPKTEGGGELRLEEGIRAPADVLPQSECDDTLDVESAALEVLTAAPTASASDEDGPRTVLRTCRVTAYCDRGTTAAGIPSGVGQCAAPADIPFGSLVYIPALDRTFVVTDRTHRRFRRSTVDLFIPSKQRCRAFGRRFLECEFTLAEEPVPYGKVSVHAGRRPTN